MPYSFSRRFVHRRALDRIEGHFLHQRLQAFGDRRFAATHRAQQIQDLLLFLQPLRGMAEIGHHLLDRVLHAVELGEGGVDLDDLVGEQTRQPGVVACVDGLGFTDGAKHALGGGGIRNGVAFAFGEVLLEGEFLFARALEAGREMADDIHAADLLYRTTPRRATFTASGEVLMKPVGGTSSELSFGISLVVPQASFILSWKSPRENAHCPSSSGFAWRGSHTA
jgi:hypothetical protein